VGGREGRLGPLLFCRLDRRPRQEVIVWYAIFTIDGTNLTSEATTKAITNMAESYFALCATIPYEGVDKDVAWPWLDEYVSQIKPGEYITTVIGGVRFRLFGDESETPPVGLVYGG